MWRLISDVLLKKLLAKEELITDPKRQLKEIKGKQNLGVESSNSVSEIGKHEKVLVVKIQKFKSSNQKEIKQSNRMLNLKLM